MNLPLSFVIAKLSYPPIYWTTILAKGLSGSMWNFLINSCWFVISVNLPWKLALGSDSSSSLEKESLKNSFKDLIPAN